MFVRAGIAIMAATLASIHPGQAGQASVTCFQYAGIVSCSGEWGEARGSFPKIIHVPEPKGDKETAEAEQEYRQWLERCRPVLRENRYGVGEYHYAKPGCEFGKTQN